MKQKKPINNQDHNEDLFIFSALSGVATVIVIQLLAQSNISSYLNFALYCFAFSIPMSVASVAAIYIEKTNRIKSDVGYMKFANWSAAITTVLGFGAIFFHFNCVLGIIFSSSSFIALIFISIYSDHLDQDNNKK